MKEWYLKWLRFELFVKIAQLRTSHWTEKDWADRFYELNR